MSKDRCVAPAIVEEQMRCQRASRFRALRCSSDHAFCTFAAIGGCRPAFVRGSKRECRRIEARSTGDRQSIDERSARKRYRRGRVRPLAARSRVRARRFRACAAHGAALRTRLQRRRVTHSGSRFELRCASRPYAAGSAGLRRFDTCGGSCSPAASMAPRRCGGRRAIADVASATPAMPGITSRSIPAANAPANHRRCIRRRCRPPRPAPPPCSRLRSRSRCR